MSEENIHKWHFDWHTFIAGMIALVIITFMCYLLAGCAQGIYHEKRLDGTVIEIKVNTLFKDIKLPGLYESESNPVSIWTLWGVGKTKEGE